MRAFGIIDLFYLAFAMRWTVLLTFLALTGGSIIGLLIAALGASRRPLFRRMVAGYVGVVQGVPLLAWLFVFYFGFPIFGITVPPLIAASVGFSVYASSYLGEIWRGALISIPKVQWESGDSIGLTYVEQLRYTIVPQAVFVATPPTIGFVVQLIKNTSLAAVIGFVELTRESQMTAAATYQPLTVYLIAASFYFALCYPLARYGRFLEGRFQVIR